MASNDGSRVQTGLSSSPLLSQASPSRELKGIFDFGESVNAVPARLKNWAMEQWEGKCELC